MSNVTWTCDFPKQNQDYVIKEEGLNAGQVVRALSVTSWLRRSPASGLCYTWAQIPQVLSL